MHPSVLAPWALISLVAAVVSGTAVAEDSIPAETVVALKRATVFVRVESPSGKGSGSGFVVRAEKDSVLIATNMHVIARDLVRGNSRKARVDLRKALEGTTVTVVFDSGTKSEISARAEVLAGDPVDDLAILRATGLKAVPTPIDYQNAPTPAETMPVYVFGFPFGEMLATGKGSPAITVGKGTVSSLRNDDSGELAAVQIDGAINPGNSGGPVVDAQGRLIGVTVSKLRDGQGIGFAVPRARLAAMMLGSVQGMRVDGTRASGGKLSLRVEVGVLNPTGSLRGATLHYLFVPPNGPKPNGDVPLAGQAGVKAAPMAINGDLAIAELMLNVKEGDLYAQAFPDGGAGASGGTDVHDFSLALPKDLKAAYTLGPAGSRPAGPGAGETAPPDGWREYRPGDGSFVVWIPQQNKSQSERGRTLSGGPFQIKMNALMVETTQGLAFTAERLSLAGARGEKPNPASLAAAYRAIAIGDPAGAKVVREVEVRNGELEGDEYLIQRGGVVNRARVFSDDRGGFILRAIGQAAQVESADATRFLDSCRRAPAGNPLAGAPRPPANDPNAGGFAGGSFATPPPPSAGPATLPPPTAGRGPRVKGGAFDPESTDVAPPGGLLVGLELGLAKFFDNDVIHAVRPIYRAGEKESTGKQYGTDLGRVVKVVARPGYAVGAIIIKTGLGLDGLSVIFMKVAKDRLDPSDSYESEWIGGPGGDAPEQLGGDGTAVVGIVAKTNKKDATGFGLIYQDDAKALAGTNARAASKGGPNSKASGKGGRAMAGEPTRIQGGGGDPEFRDAGPEGALLIGVEVGLGDFFNKPVVRTVRPVYRPAKGTKLATGQWHGSTKEGSVVGATKAVARPGYAVGAITVKNGLSVDGFSLTFMKVNDGQLDPNDSYESEWIGGPGGGGPEKISGNGRPVIGLIGKTRPDNTTGLGLLLAPLQ
ncbi:MAG: trypsin-like peptidase domain-containing protein [Isosphaeraceae bacterium]